MRREFDAQAYAKALEEFIVQMERLHEEDREKLQEVMSLIAGHLGVAYEDAVIFDDMAAEQRGSGTKVVFYDSGSAGKEFSFTQREIVGPGRVVHYTFFPFQGEEDWDEEERFRLTVLVNLLNVFNRRLMSIRLGQYHATHEPDFGMYNVAFLTRKVGEYSARHILGEFGACYFNIKRLSVINAEYGRDQGTRLVKGLLTKLDELLTDKEELIWRIGGDNFGVLFHRNHMEEVLKCLSGTVIKGVVPGEEGIRISAWVGVYLLPETVQSPTEVMDGIAFAVGAAKSSRSDHPVFFDEQMVDRMAEARRVQFLFAEAVQKEEFLVYYQPKVLLKGYQLAGAEALCRWRHEGEMIMPYKFIPVFEQSSRICQLDFYMLEHVCRDIRRWLDERRKVVRISVNFSRRHFGDRQLLEHIVEIIDRYQVPHKYIEIELTETSSDVDFRDLKELVTGLKEQGIRTSVDDFGTGYSSLNLIRELPWDVLKLDKSFVDNTEEDNAKRQMMFGHVIAMARELGMDCITEGVETVEQIQLLKENNCFMVQGYFFDKPLPVEEFEERLGGCDYQRDVDLRPLG